MMYRTSIAPFFSLRRDIDRLFEDVMGRDGTQGGWAPAVDVREDENALVLELEIPGVSPEQVEVTAENGVLTIRGEKRSERREDDEKRRWHLVERSYGAFHRAFQLPKGVDEGQIEASFDQGVLTVRVPKSALPQPRRIEIRGTTSDAARVSGPAESREEMRAGSGAHAEAKSR
ncbi:MAG TPA: Hsp20/alpha crystallin family protein [Gemmatimonadaceae bacterium]